jgi:hypothetical protein
MHNLKSHKKDQHTLNPGVPHLSHLSALAAYATRTRNLPRISASNYVVQRMRAALIEQRVKEAKRRPARSEARVVEQRNEPRERGRRRGCASDRDVPALPHDLELAGLGGDVRDTLT